MIDYLRDKKETSTIGLWGRSMGAVTTLLYASKDPTIASIVVDSPFSSLSLLADELVQYHTKIPLMIGKIAKKFVRKSVQAKANFDINNLAPINVVENCYSPAMFVVANSDDFILPSHGEALHGKYAGDKNLVRVEGDHNSDRPDFFLNSAGIFYYNTLLPPEKCYIDTNSQNDFKLPMSSKIEIKKPLIRPFLSEKEDLEKDLEREEDEDSLSEGEIRLDEGELLRLDKLMIDAQSYHKKCQIVSKLKE